MFYKVDALVDTHLDIIHHFRFAVFNAHPPYIFSGPIYAGKYGIDKISFEQKEIIYDVLYLSAMANYQKVKSSI